MKITQYKLSSLFSLLFVLLCVQVYSQTPVKTDSVVKTHATMASLPATGTLYLSDSVPGTSYCSKTLTDAKIKVLFRLGETYKFGSSAFTSQVKVKIEAYPYFSGGTVPVDVYWATINLDQDNPEELYVRDFTNDHSLIKRFDVSVYSYTAPGAPKNDSVQLYVYYEETFGVNVSGVDIDNIAPTSIVNPVTFNWDRGGCTDIPNYQFQLLRVYNNNCSGCITDVTNITSIIDWDKALTIETGSSDTTLTLSVVEGSGYYIWRVRPIGTYYEGGIADSRNWGSWSDNTYTDGVSYNFNDTLKTSVKFFYTQFDDTLNWIYSRVFSERDPISPKVRVSEKITYANGLQQVKQNQAHLQSLHQVVVNQTVLDWSGRPALSTLPAPISSDTLYYRTGFIRRGSTLYTASDFDEDSNYKNPSAITAGPLVDYYSNSNADLTIPNAEGFPFSRTLYERDGTGAVKEQSGPGETHKLKTINARTTRTFYSGVSNMELIRVFGDEAPAAEGVRKVITVDPNSIASISYKSKEGQVIATCLSVVDSTLMDTLASQGSARFTVTDTVKGSIKLGDFGILSTKPLALATPTNVTFNYSITAQTIQHLCMDLCKTCDYTIEFLIKNDDTTKRVSKLIEAQACNLSTPSWDTSFTVSLAAGEYFIQKRIYSNNNIPSSLTDSTGYTTYLQSHLDSLEQRLRDTATAKLSCVLTALANSDLTSLYGGSCLNINTNIADADSVFADSTVTFDIGCTNIEIPILFCESYDCSDSTPDFEAYFNSRWASTSYVGTSGGYLKYFPNNLSAGKIGYRPGEFNTVVANMIAESGFNGYSCAELWECWTRLTMTYESLKELSDSSATYDLDLLQEFLRCTGTKYKGYSTTDTTKYKYKPYEYFYYSYGSNTLCDSATTLSYGAQPWTQDSINGLVQNQKYKNYFNCIRYSDIPTGVQIPSITNSAAAAECGCKGICDARYEGFKMSLIQMYHNDSIYVEGDLYKLRKDTTWGQVYAYDTALLVSQPAAAYYRTMAEIECAARSLVEKCKESCELTIYSSGGTVDSVGSSAQIAAMQQAMTWTYELSLPSCGVGYTQVLPPSSSSDTLIKLWEQHYGSTGNDQLWDIVEDKNGCGGYLLAGWTESTDTTYDITQGSRGSRDYWVVRVNCDGAKVWDRRLGGSSSDTLRSIIQTSDGGYLLGGTSLSDSLYEKTDSSRGDADYWVIRLDAAGNIIWDKTYGGSESDVLTSVTETSDGYFLLGGYSDSDLNGEKSQASYGGSYDYWLLKVNSNGVKIWDKRYGTTGADIMVSVREGKNKKYLLGGHSADQDNDRTSGINKNDYWIVITDTAGVLQDDISYGGAEHDYMSSMEVSELEEDSSIIIAGISLSNSYSGSYPSYGKTQNAFTTGGNDAWVVKTDKDGRKIWDKIYGGTLAEGPIYHVDIKQLTKESSLSYVLGVSSKSARATGNKVDSLYADGYDYWFVKLDTAGTKKWDRSFGAQYNDLLTSVDVDVLNDYWIAGYSYSDSTGGTNGNKKTHNYGTSSTTDYWVIRGREKCTHDTICFKWVEPPTIHDSLITQYELISCDSANAQAIYNSIMAQVEQYIQTELAAFEADYIATCANPDSITDTLTLTYPLGYHHYTLYYYDRAGNLVRTVAPEGVQKLTGSQLNNRQTHPSHTFVTKYKYNSIKQLEQQYTPDGDSTSFWYDYKGQLRFSQNKKQKNLGAYSYTKYDNLGRTIEVGQSTNSIATFTTSANLNDQTFPSSNNTERTYTVYNTQEATALYLGMKPQRYLQNRISYTYTEENVYTYYSYDPHGNVEWLIQDIPGLGKNYIGYEYDLTSGKMLKVHYNDGAVDQFHHRYTYDEDQRIKLAETSANGNIWDKDASYSYYKHGPLKRTAIGEDKIQGMDYVYTLEGWLKGINHPSLSTSNDPGGDGASSGYGTDQFGMVLGYHDNDFNRTSSPYNPPNASLVSSSGSASNLYNGNISSWTFRSGLVGAAPGGNTLMGMKYRYDQLNRLKHEDYHENTGSWSNVNYYDNTYTYDANGNILTLIRNGSTTNVNMDNLTYTYQNDNNRLSHVDDAVSAANYTDDIDDQNTNNFKYDAIGNLAKDVKEGIDTIVWNVYGKVKYIKKSSGDSIVFGYDAAGNRVWKRVYNASGPDTRITYYVKDAQSTPMSIYERTTSGSNYVYKQKELPIYGSSRVGIYKPNQVVKTVPMSGASSYSCVSCTVFEYVVNILNSNGYYERAISKKNYELNDHLGNIRVVVHDQNDATNNPVIASYTHYYAFGSPMPGKNYSSPDYRYGFNGKQHDNEISVDGGHYDFEARIYDSRTGRFLSVDPDAPKYPFMTPYCFAANSPIKLIDKDGKGPVDPRTGSRISSNIGNVKNWEILYQRKSSHPGPFAYDGALAIAAGFLGYGSDEGDTWRGLQDDDLTSYHDRVVPTFYANVSYDGKTETIDLTSTIRASKDKQAYDPLFEGAQTGNYGFVSEDWTSTNFTVYEVQDGWINRESYFEKGDTKDNYYLSKQTTFTTSLTQTGTRKETRINAKTGARTEYSTPVYQVSVIETTNTYDKSGKVTGSENKTYSYSKDGATSSTTYN